MLSASIQRACRRRRPRKMPLRKTGSTLRRMIAESEIRRATLMVLHRARLTNSRMIERRRGDARCRLPTAKVLMSARRSLMK